jgi:hypothetical protein
MRASYRSVPKWKLKLKMESNSELFWTPGVNVNLLSENVYDKLKTRAEVPIRPLENVVLVTAFGRHSRKITSQALLEFNIGEDDFEGVFMISPQLAMKLSLGVNC